MRRLFFLAVLFPVGCLGWLLWVASCERDNYRNELPLRSFDAAPTDLVSTPGQDAAPADLRTPPDLAPPADLMPPADLAPPADLMPAVDMATLK